MRHKWDNSRQVGAPAAVLNETLLIEPPRVMKGRPFIGRGPHRLIDEALHVVAEEGPRGASPINRGLGAENGGPFLGLSPLM